MSYEGEQTAISGGVARDGTPRLLDQVRGRLRLKHYSLRTEQAYLYWIRRYVRAWLPRHPAELDGAAVESFLTGLATRDQVAASTRNQALAALLFLYRAWALGCRGWRTWPGRSRTSMPDRRAAPPWTPGPLDPWTPGPLDPLAP